MLKQVVSSCNISTISIFRHQLTIMKAKIFLVLLFVSSIVYGQELKDSLPKDPNTITGILPNGMRYYIRKNTKPEHRAELRLAVNAGSTSENENQQGIAHFTEHMAFNGTESFKKSELVDYLESVGTKFGPHLNAYTSFDETVYMLQIPTDKEEILSKGLQILENWSHRLLFDSMEVQKERGVVVEEWRLGQGAEERMRRTYWPVLFTNSRYAERLPIGKKEIIEGASLQTIKDFYNDWYRPELMAVIAVGDFDPLQMEKNIKDIFSKVPVKKSNRPVQAYPVPDTKELLIATATDKEARFARIQLLYKEPFETNKTVEDYRKSLSEQLFTSMLNNRLSEITRQPQPPFIFAGTDFGSMVRNRYVYECTAVCREDAIDSAMVRLVNENERVRRFGFTTTEFERAKAEMLRGYEQSFNERDKNESRDYAREYVSNFLTAEPMPGIEYEYQIAKKFIPGIKLDEVNGFAKQWITDGKNAIVIITAPEKPSTKIPSKEQIASVIKDMQAAKLEQYVDKVDNAPLLSAELLSGSPITSTEMLGYGVQHWTLKNGISVYAKATEFKNDQVLFNSFGWGGWSLYPVKDFMSASYADEIIDESGFGNFSSTTLEKKLSGKVVGCSPYISELQQGFNGSCSTKDMETLFQLIYGYATSPRKDADAFASLIQKQKSILKNRSADPQSIFADTVSYIWSGYNERFKPKTENTLDEIALDRAIELYKERFANFNGASFVFVGNFNIDSLKSMTVKYLGSLPSAQVNSSYKDLGMDPPKGKITKTVKKGQAPRSTVLLRWSMPFEYTRNNRNEMNALNKLVSIRLREVLREDKSGVYGVGFNSNPKHYPTSRLEQTISFSCNPDNADMLISAAKEVLDEVRKNGCDEKNLTKIKETFIRERESSMQENSFWLSVISSTVQNKENIDELKTYNEWVNSLKGSDFISFASKYLKDENFAQFVLKPE
jgi:zinc protease